MATTHITQMEQPRAASFGKLLMHQARMELIMTLRQGERVMVTLFIPILLLVGFNALKVVPIPAHESATDVLLPGVLALAIISAGMVSLGIATAYERNYGVLKRLGSSPLTHSALILAKIISVLALELIQTLILVAFAVLLYGWHPAGSLPLALLAAMLGTVTFAALGLAMAGALRASTTLVSTNTLYLLFVFIGGGFFPLDRLPGPLAALAQLLPASALTSALQNTMLAGSAFPSGAFLTLAIWAAIILGVAIKTFQWE